MTDKTVYNPLRGIAFKVVSLVLFISMQGFVKEGGRGMSAGEVTFFRSAFAMVPVLAWLAYRNQLATAFKTDNISGHFSRGLIGACSMMLGFYGILHLPLPESIALGYAMPLMTVVAGAVLLGEAVHLYRWSAVMVGLVGVMIILWPRLTLHSGMGVNETWGAMAVLGSAVLAALAMVQVRQLVRTEDTPTIVLYFSLSAALYSLLTLPFGWTFPTGHSALFLITAGFIGGVAQILLTQSYRFAEVSTVAPFEYTSIIWGTLIGYVFFSEIPTWSVVIGAVIVIASGIFIIFRERKLSIERSRVVPIR